jgi:hypothetical protein
LLIIIADYIYSCGGMFGFHIKISSPKYLLAKWFLAQGFLPNHEKRKRFDKAIIKAFSCIDEKKLSRSEKLTLVCAAIYISKTDHDLKCPFSIDDKQTLCRMIDINFLSESPSKYGLTDGQSLAGMLTKIIKSDYEVLTGLVLPTLAGEGDDHE